MAEEGVMHLVKGIASYSSIDAFSGISRAVFGLALTSFLVPEQFGQLAIIYVAVVYATIISQFGLPYNLSSHFSKTDPALNIQQMNLALSANFGLALFTIPFCLLAICLVPGIHPPSKALPLVAFWISCNILLYIPGNLLIYQNRIVHYGLIQFSRIATLFLSIFIFYKRGPIDVTSVVAAETVSTFVALVVAMVCTGYVPRFNFSPVTGSIVKAAIPLCLMDIAFCCIDLSDRYLITLFRGNGATGLYAVAGRIAIVGSMLAESYYAIWSARYYRNNSSENVKARMPQVFWGGALVIGALIFLLPLCANLKIHRFYLIAPAFHSAIALINPYVLQYGFKIGFYFFLPVLILKHRRWAAIAIVSTGALLNIAINLFILKTGIFHSLSSELAGIAYSTTIGYAFILGAVYFVSRKNDAQIKSASPLHIAAFIFPVAASLIMWFCNG